MKRSLSLNLERQGKDNKKNNKDVKKTYEFYKKHSDEDTFEKQIIEHKKVETPYLPPTAQDAQTIADEIKNEIDNFLQTASEFNKIDTAATKQKKVDFYDKLFDDVKDIPGTRQIIDDTLTTEEIFVDDKLFSNADTKDTKNLVDIITQEIDVNHSLFDHVPIDTTPNVPESPDPFLIFSDILLPKNKRENVIAKK